MGRQRRYLGLEVLAKARAVLTARQTDTPQQVPTDLIAGALSV